ncbi:hypothetical protein F9L16_23585 [Agarivorans sp. B2Z047]|uniref:phage regulatory CII family protein n=1 Tax=Agarivorans sp. B2Z047 TaxID=2652721 RepID=UPI00128CDDB5|nr:phage regulatory CII family protein [Agarivorans sp. B2Z047]MPW31940.1 hypothetical protein [Agarivorans sp. B2Z047]UQN41909.1 phage regulatory CII family protein [Agarivorans sp. B2Z047]
MQTNNTIDASPGDRVGLDMAFLQIRRSYDLSRLAKLLKKRPSVLRNKLNQGVDTHHLTVNELLDLTRVTNDFSLVDGLLLDLGRTSIPIATTSGSIDLCEKALRVNELSGELAAAAMQRAKGERPTERWLLNLRQTSSRLMNEAGLLICKLDQGAINAPAVDLLTSGALAVAGI